MSGLSDVNFVSIQTRQTFSFKKNAAFSHTKFMHETFHFYNQQRRSCISTRKISSATDEEEEVLPSKCYDVAASSGGDSFKVCSLNLCRFYCKNVH